MKNEAAIAAFLAAAEEAADLARKIAQHMEDYMGVDPETLNWGHVGDANAIIAGLKEVEARFA